MKTDIDEIKESLKIVELHPSLEAVVKPAGLNATQLTVGFKTQNGKLDLSARQEVVVRDDANSALWTVPSLRALFRGDKQPPSMPAEPHPAYLPLFYFIEAHVVAFCDAFGDQTDSQFKEAYSNLRRRPDGSSMDPLHFCLWQVAALLVGTHSVSAAEFEAIFTRLTHSATTFRMGLVSRNYVGVLRNHT